MNAVINAHTHLELSGLSNLLPQPSAEFSDWLANVIRANACRTAEDTYIACEAGIGALLASGTTHVGDISASGASVELLCKSGLQGIVWIEILATTFEQGMMRLEAVKQLVAALREKAANSPIQVGATLHSTYSIHPRLWEPVLRWVEAEHLPFCVHAAESPAEWEVLTHGHGPFRTFEGRLVAAYQVAPRWRALAARFLAALPPRLRLYMERWGIPYHLPAPYMTPIEYLEHQGALAFKPLLIHAVQVSDKDIANIKRHGATVVHCPRSNQYLECGRMPLEKYLAADVPVLLGTDSLTSNPSLNVKEEAAFAQELHAGQVSADSIHELLHAVKTFENCY